jgi:hypothetical protein
MDATPEHGSAVYDDGESLIGFAITGFYPGYWTVFARSLRSVQAVADLRTD